MQTDATTPNNTQQHDTGCANGATFSTQQCWELLAGNNVASVCMGLYVHLTVQRHRVRLWKIVKRKKRGSKNERNHGCTVAYADDFVTERKSIASLDRFDCIQFKMNFDFFPLNYTFKFFTDTCTFSTHIVVRVLHFSLSSLLRTCSMDQDPLFKLSAKKLLGIHFRL